LPSAVRAYVGPTGATNPVLTDNQRRLLDATRGGARSVEDLAAGLGLSEHALVDLAEELLDKGLLVEVDDGAALAASRVDG
jgi:biotin operon repressor